MAFLRQLSLSLLSWLHLPKGKKYEKKMGNKEPHKRMISKPVKLGHQGAINGLVPKFMEVGMDASGCEMADSVR